MITLELTDEEFNFLLDLVMQVKVDGMTIKDVRNQTIELPPFVVDLLGKMDKK